MDIFLTELRQSLTSGSVVEGLEDVSSSADTLYRTVKQTIDSLNETFSFFSGIEPSNLTLLDSDLDKVLSQRTYADVKRIKVFRPANLTASFYDYANYIVLSLEKLSDIDKRVLKPLNEWVAMATTDPTHASRLWTHKPTFLDIKEIQEGLADKFHRSVVSDSEDSAAFYELYPTTDSFRDTGQILMELQNLSDSQDYQKILDAESKLMANIKIMMDDEVLFDASERNIKLVSEYLRRASAELELFGVMVYQAKRAVQAYVDSQEHLKKSLA